VDFKINKTACQSNNVPIEQAGARLGQSAIEMEISKVLKYETIRNQRLHGGVIYNNAKACYDTVIENISNLALLHQGLPIKLAQLHSHSN
jgi:hypothetical protein